MLLGRISSWRFREYGAALGLLLGNESSRESLLEASKWKLCEFERARAGAVGFSLWLRIARRITCDAVGG